MPVDEVMRKTSSTGFNRWKAYFLLTVDPLDQIAWLIARLCALFYNAWKDKDAEQLAPNDFMLKPFYRVNKHGELKKNYKPPKARDPWDVWADIAAIFGPSAKKAPKDTE